MLETMRRKRRSNKMKSELGQSVDHFRRAAAIAAQETGATVGPKFNAARERVQPVAGKARDAAASGWGSTVATLGPMVASAAGNVRQANKETKKAAKANRKAAEKNAKKLEKRTNKALGRKQRGRKTSTLLGIALVGGAVGAGAAYAVRRRRAAQWDEYDPAEPVDTPTAVIDTADDAAFEPTDQTETTAPAAGAGLDAAVAEDPTLRTGTADQTSSTQHSPEVARMASGKNSD
ncbi:hypothetical protein [Mangrovihabitans endophyticus]|uniref:Uncharacterized protein n=1 Tax=Mangrovihabitans endophyticus TaxID=1751298 RepID=A0A8J3BYJ3_9ACTN|nr:hypothetical protein [Mangrovihabitans endophyticus]GGK93937.1 hypothetical protein GCM10012284_29990 [Mangrovihabitans endophyticus]